MIPLFVQFSLSATAMILAAIFLTRATDRIAQIANFGRLFSGSILLAGATSLPELLVDISAVKADMPDLAVGDLMGSSLMNLLILAIADLSHRNPNKMFSRAGAQHALSAAVSINMTVLACIAIFLGAELTNLNVGDVGLGAIAIAIFYVLGYRLIFYDSNFVKHPQPPKLDKNWKSLFGAVTLYLLSAVTIFFAAPHLALSAGKVATVTGLSKTFIGSSMLALCTSLPEIVSTYAAVRMGAFDLAVGNIFGSNSFNMILLLPLDFIHEGNLLGSVSRNHILTGLSVILASSVAVMGQLYQVEKRTKIIEPDAFAIILIVLIAFWILYYLGPV